MCVNQLLFRLKNEVPEAIHFQFYMTAIRCIGIFAKRACVVAIAILS